MRSARPDRLPVALPERLLHGRRPHHRHGRRLNLTSLVDAAERQNVPIDPTDFNRNDGFSPGEPIVTRCRASTTRSAFHRTGAVPITDIARSYDPDQPIVVINADPAAPPDLVGDRLEPGRAATT